MAEQEEMIKKIEERQVWEPAACSSRAQEAGNSVRARGRIGLWVYTRIFRKRSGLYSTNLSALTLRLNWSRISDPAQLRSCLRGLRASSLPIRSGKPIPPSGESNPGSSLPGNPRCGWQSWRLISGMRQTRGYVRDRTKRGLSLAAAGRFTVKLAVEAKRSHQLGKERGDVAARAAASSLAARAASALASMAERWSAGLGSLLSKLGSYWFSGEHHLKGAETSWTADRTADSVKVGLQDGLSQSALGYWLK
eukprot:768674-Hanusia_phi.AAC.3